MTWKAIENIGSLGSFEVRYGEFTACIDLTNNPRRFHTYTVRLHVYEISTSYVNGLMYEASFEITQDRLYGVVDRGDKITPQAIMKLIKPLVDYAHLALFCCVAEKLICD